MLKLQTGPGHGHLELPSGDSSHGDGNHGDDDGCCIHGDDDRTHIRDHILHIHIPCHNVLHGVQIDHILLRQGMTKGRPKSLNISFTILSFLNTTIKKIFMLLWQKAKDWTNMYFVSPFIWNWTKDDFFTKV